MDDGSVGTEDEDGNLEELDSMLSCMKNTAMKLFLKEKPSSDER